MAFGNWKTQGTGSPLPQGLQKECSPVDLLVTSDLQTEIIPLCGFQPQKTNTTGMSKGLWNWNSFKWARSL